MTLKNKIRNILKIIIELVVLILLILFIHTLLKSENGLLSSINKGEANEKLDEAVKIFTATEVMTLEDAIRKIEGLEELKINEETGEYDIKIDGQQFLIISKEIKPEEKIEIEKVEEGEKNGEEN